MAEEAVEAAAAVVVAIAVTVAVEAAIVIAATVAVGVLVAAVAETTAVAVTPDSPRSSSISGKVAGPGAVMCSIRIRRRRNSSKSNAGLQ